MLIHALPALVSFFQPPRVSSEVQQPYPTHPSNQLGRESARQYQVKEYPPRGCVQRLRKEVYPHKHALQSVIAQNGVHVHQEDVL